MSAIELVDVSKSWDSSSALVSINLQIEQGTFYRHIANEFASARRRLHRWQCLLFNSLL
jgi:hypothetical protein